MSCLIDSDEEGDLDYDDEELEDEEEEAEEEAPVTARPRRLSEIHKTPTKIKPLPKASSFFIFSHTNRLVVIRKKKFIF